MAISNNDGINDTENNSRGSRTLVRWERLDSRVRNINFPLMSDETILPAVPTDPINAVFGASFRLPRLDVIQPNPGDPIIEVNNRRVAEPANIDLSNFSIRTGISEREALQKLEMCMRYSLNIYNFPPCPEEDLMLAVYFFLEKKLNVKFRMWECATYKLNRNEQVQEQVGVIFYRMQSADAVLRRAEIVLKEPGINIKPNTNRELIILAMRKRIELPTV